ncbi:hypothetical protein NQ318_022594 [Aromia moschata]|uniref:Uncharacterized protein n=1 Tax=Aromia moschata TaxID=1265417 RepID=A0AAV8XX09_9CUCU|nr:hypothetical protein NQ318_022594 [Aromia moschata]
MRRSIRLHRQQVCNKTSQKVKSHKIEILDLDEIALPDIEELKENLMPWLVSKQQYCNVDDTETDKNVVNISNEKYCNEIKHKPELIDSSTQYESIKSITKETQWESSLIDACIEGHKKDENSPSKYMKPKTRFTKRSQEMLTTNKDQCSLIERSDKESQYELSSGEIRTQTEGDLFTGTIGDYKAKDPTNVRSKPRYAGLKNNKFCVVFRLSYFCF